MAIAHAVSFQKLGVLDQITTAVKRSNRLASLVGLLLGGFIPAASYTICHKECPADARLWVLVVAGLTYSAFTVFSWARTAFRHPAKALGFVVLTEGIILFSSTAWLSGTALAILMAINGIATATNLISDRRANRKVRV